MTYISPPTPPQSPAATTGEGGLAKSHGRLAAFGAALLATVGLGTWLAADGPAAPPPPPGLPHVTIAAPLRETVAPATGFLGQFSALNSVELRAQVGGVLTGIGFQDGEIVHKGDLLFSIDPRPYEVRRDQAIAQLQTAAARKILTGVELWRAQQLKRSDYGSAETLDQRAADERSAEAAIATARAAITDAELDLEFSRVVAPFTGRIGAHQVSVGNLVSGSRGGSSPTTLLATLVSLDPIYLDFDMSEAEYLAFQRAHSGTAPRADVAISLDGDGHFDRHGTLDFIDNAVNRGSGTIHARATVPNPDFALTPGEFARLRLTTGKAGPVLLVPAAAIVPDQSRETVMVVAADGTVAPKVVETGDLWRGLRIIRAGLAPDDRVIIDGLMLARPGSKVVPDPGAIAAAAPDVNG